MRLEAAPLVGVGLEPHQLKSTPLTTGLFPGVKPGASA